MNTSPTILIVEDDDDDLFFTQRALRKCGFSQLYHAANGSIALDYLSGRGAFSDRAAYPLPDIMLVDLKMPEVDGHQLLEWIHADKKLSGIKTFVLSSSGEARDRDRAKAAGVVGYFVKPLTVQDAMLLPAATA